ncbi:MAG: nucleotidyl transferase AbiEii/AbiGii toxin family protein [Parabacteroides sp.]|nr:nucleotidyl transferase AbiEii/AbiGii toxin family protein [Parabacteroides sp.]
MLHYATVDPSTLELLKNLQALPELKELRLVGGTSLALQIGHRKSVDLDLFGKMSLEADELTELIQPLGNITILKNSRNIHVFTINGIKADIVNYTYPWLNDAIFDGGLQLADQRDICAMKLAAVTGRGTRKDFIDIYFLLRSFSMETMFNFYMQKYTDASSFMVVKSLTYFEDAENEPEPYMFEPVNWNLIKAEIRKQASRLI